MCTIKERITSIINSLDEIIENSNEVEPIYQKIENLEEYELRDLRDELCTEQNYICSSLDVPEKLHKQYHENEKMFEKLLKKIKEIKREFDFYDPETEIQMMFPNGSGDPEFDASWGIGEFARDNDEDEDW